MQGSSLSRPSDLRCEDSNYQFSFRKGQRREYFCISPTGVEDLARIILIALLTEVFLIEIAEINDSNLVLSKPELLKVPEVQMGTRSGNHQATESKIQGPR